MVKIWGTSGIRRVFAPFGDEYSNFTPKAALKIGLAIGAYVNGGTVVVGRDIRTTALPIELSLNSGLVSQGCKVLSLGMVTTPTLAMATGFLKGDVGIMITASHNTPEYIGVKLWNPSGLGFTPEQEKEVEEIYMKKKFRTITWDQIGSITYINDINEQHVYEIMKLIQFGPNKKRPNVIIDPGNGSSCEIAPLLLKKLGCKFVTLNSNPDGYFPGRLSEPNSKNLKTLIDIITHTDYLDFGMALDGDADRVIFIDGNGKLIEPIRMLAFLSKQLLLHDPPRNAVRYKIMTPINSSGVLEAVVEPLGGRVVRTQVGDIKVAIEIQKQHGILGGENAGTYIWPKFHFGPDSLVTIAKIIELLSYTDKTFTELIQEIPEFPFVQKEYKLKGDFPITLEDYQKMKDILVKWLEEEEGFSEIRSNFIDGVRLDFKDAWILVRRSGTSPIIRIAGEDNYSIDKANYYVDTAAELLKDEF
ncbi:MAG: phosphoglucosamine mutase, partial [Promethearchaeota archaeon]